MSRTIDERVVSMQFDNRQFESNVRTSMGTLEKLKQSLNFKGAAKSFEDIDSAVRKVNVASLGNAAHTVGLRFSAMYTMADQALRNITTRVQQTAEHMAKAFTTDPIKTGFQEYETQINAVQTILANTESKGTTLNDVNGALDELNKYADKTIYNFTEMTRNIGTFTAAGVDLDTSVNAIQGIANLAAISGSTSQQASTAMYQLSQALASGTVKLMDWNSVVNAGMGGQVFQDALKETARAHGVAIDSMIKKQGSFRETLSEGWLTSEILTDTLQKFTLTTEGLTDAQIEQNRAMLKAKGYSDEQIDNIFKLGETATNAATKVKTFTQLMDTLKEAAQSGWTQTWELIVGDFEESKSLWTGVSETIGNIINDMSDRRNKLLGGALNSNWEKLTEKINAAGIETSVFEEKVKSLLKQRGYNVDKLIEKYGSLEGVFKSGAVHSSTLKKAIEELGKSTGDVDLSGIVGNLKKGMTGEDVKKAQKALQALGHDLSKFGVDGIFGKETEAAVRAFQEAHGLTVDGILGPKTLAAMEEASKKTAEFEDSIYGLIDGVDELGGRDLLIESFKNVWQALVRPITAVKNAFREVFPPMTSEQLFNFIKGFHDFTEKLVMSEESAAKVGKIFKGLFSILEVGTTIVGGGLKLAFKAVSKILEHFDLNILDVAAAAGDAMVKFRDWLFENNRLAGAFDKIIDYAVKAGTAIRDWIKEFVELPVVQKNIKRFQSAFSNAFKKIKAIFGDVGKIFGDFFKSFATMDGFSIENIKMAFLTLYEALHSYFSNLKVSDIFGGIGKAFKKFKTDAKKYLEGAGIKIDEIKEKIISFVQTIKEKLGDNMGTILAVGVLLTFLFLVKKIKDAVQLIAKPFEMVDDFLDNLGATLKAFGKAAKANALKNIAISIAILAGSVAVLALLDQGKVWSAVGAVLALSAILVSLSFLLSKFKPGDFGKLSVSLLGLAGSVLLMGIAAKTISGLDAMGLLKTGIVLAAFLGMVAVLSKSTKGISMWVADFGKMMVKLSIALILLAFVAKIFGKMDTGVLIQGGLAVAAFLGMMVGMMAATKLLKKNLPQFGKMMLGISASLILMAYAVKILGKMDLSTVIRGGIIMAAFLGVTSIMAAMTKRIGKDAGQFGKMMFGLGASLILMAIAIKMLGSMDAKTVTQGAVAVTALLGVMALMMGATKLLGKNSGSAAKVGVMMLAFSGALLIMTASIGLLGMMDADNIDKAVSAITKIGLLFGALVVISRFAGEAKNVKGTIMTMSIAVAVLAVSVAALSFVDSSKLTGATTALSVVMGMFTLLVGMTGLMKKSAGTLAVMIGVVLVLGGVLYLLSTLPIESTLSAAASLSMLILSLSVSCFLLSMVPIAGALSGIASLAILIAGIGLIMAAIAGLNKLFPDMEQFLSESLPIIETIGNAIGSFVGGIIGGIAEGITSSLPQIGTDLSNFMTNLTPFIDGAKSIDETALTGAENLAKTILLLTGASLLESITSWITGGSSMSEFANQLVPFGEAMVAFSSKVAGNIDEEAVTAAANAGKIMAEMAETLPNSGGVVGFFAGENDMATFAAGLVPFGEAMATFSSKVTGNVDEAAVTSAANAGKIMAEMATTLPNSGGVVGFFAGENDMATFAAGLVPFGEAMATFSSKVSGNIDEAAVTAAANAGSMMAEMAATIPNTGGLVSFFAGDNDLATFGTQLVSFGTSIKTFSTEVSGIDEVAVTAAANAGTMMANLANSIPTTGGIWSIFAGDNDVATFGVQVVLFGKAIKNFSSEVAGIDESAVTAAANAGSTLATMAKDLPESGGLWSVFAKDNDMSTFASQIVKFGKGISSFSTEVSGIDTSAVTVATTAASSLSTLANTLANAGDEGDFSGVATGAKGLGTRLKGFYTEVSEISTTKIASVTSEFTKLASVDLSGISKISETLTTIGTNGVEGFVTAFTGASAKIQAAGGNMILNLMIGVTNKKENLADTLKNIAGSGVTAVRTKGIDFYNAGRYLVDGFANGISANDYKAIAKARAMATAAKEAAEEALGIKSPSRVFYKIGAYTGQGFVNALGDYEDKTYKAGGNIAESARSGLSNAISKIRDVIVNGVDDQLTIRPVLDLSNIESGASAISGMLGNPSIRAMSHVGAISTMMSRGQNGSNSDVISAINELGKKLGNMSGNTYHVNGVTYDDGTNVSEAVKSLIRAAKVERRV